MAWTMPSTKQSQWFDLPFIGNDLSKIGRVIDLYAEPCSPGAAIWAYGFFSALPTMFLTLTKPEFIDIDIHHRHGRPRKGKRLRFLTQTIFRDAIIQIPVPRWVVFRVFEWSQRVAWYFLVADATETFAINWISMAYQYQGCTGFPVAYAHRGALNTLQGSGGSGQNVLLWSTSASQNFNFPPGGAQPAVDGIYRANWAVSFGPNSPASSSQLPNFTYLRVGGILTHKSIATESGFSNRNSTGGGLIDVIGGGGPEIAIVGEWTDPGKFCRSEGTFNIDKVLTSDLGPDP